jgi:hypothetical protein
VACFEITQLFRNKLVISKQVTYFEITNLLRNNWVILEQNPVSEQILSRNSPPSNYDLLTGKWSTLLLMGPPDDRDSGTPWCKIDFQVRLLNSFDYCEDYTRYLSIYSKMSTDSISRGIFTPIAIIQQTYFKIKSTPTNSSIPVSKPVYDVTRRSFSSQ